MKCDIIKYSSDLINYFPVSISALIRKIFVDKHDDGDFD